MKKIIYIYGNLPSYREEFFTQLSNALKAEGIELKVFYGYIVNKLTRQAEGRAYQTRKFETVQKDFKWLRFTQLAGLMEAVKDERPDGIIFQFNQTNLTQWRIRHWCLKNHIPYGIWGCNYTRADLKGFLVKMRNFLYNTIYLKASICIPYGSLYHDFLVKTGVPKERVFTAQNTIDIETIVHRELPFIPKDYSHPETRILYVGAMAPQKRLETSIEAVSLLIAEGLHIEYDIVGGGTELERLKKHWNSLSEDIKPHIHLHGAKYGIELVPFFRNADVFLMPGTGGLGVNEAMAYGLPIISTIGDETIVDLIDGNGYLLHQMGDVEGQKQAIRKFIHLTQEEKTTMSSRSAEIVMQRASLENMVNRHKEAILFMLNSESIHK